VGTGFVTVLLDTHVWIWAFEGSERLGKMARELLEDPANERWISTVSTLELARLVARSELALSCPLSDWIASSCRALRLQTQPVTQEIALESYALPGAFHPDPADRQIVATARLGGFSLLTADRRILEYPDVAALDATR